MRDLDEESDDRARPHRRGAADHRLAAAVPERGRPLPAAHRRGGGRAREADRARRHGREGADDHLEPAARRLDRRRYQTQGITLGDLIQEGVIGLIRATEKFDWRRGFKFSTYATWWIRQAVQRGVANKARTIRIPVHVVEREQKVARTERELFAKLGHAAERRRRSRSTRSSRSSRCARCARPPARSRRPTRRSAPTATRASASSSPPEARRPRTRSTPSFRGDAVRRAVSKLPERQRDVISLRFGLVGDGPNSLEQVGKQLGITRERVRQIEAEALRRLAEDSSIAALAQAHEREGARPCRGARLSSGPESGISYAVRMTTLPGPARLAGLDRGDDELRVVLQLVRHGEADGGRAAAPS